MARPFVTWAGGKRSLFGALPDAAPRAINSKPGARRPVPEFLIQAG